MERALPQGSGSTEAFFTCYKGMDAMRSPRTLYWLAVFVAVTGCRSGSGTGWATWNPFSRWGQNTAVADAAPELPSQQFAEASKSPSPKPGVAPATSGAVAAHSTSSAPAYTPPAAVTRAASTTPTTPSNALSSAPAYAPPTGSGNSLTNSPTNSAPSASMAASGPYDPNGYQAASPSAASTSAPGVNRYGLPDRYASATASSAPAMSSETAQYPGAGRYAAYDTPDVTPPPAAGATAPTTTPQVEQAAATVNLPSPPGQYRPAGTSSYPMTNPEQVNVASLPEKPATAPASQPSAAGTPAYPATGTPESGSIYGVPEYR